MAIALTRTAAIPPPSTYYYNTPVVPHLDSTIKIAMDGSLPRVGQAQLEQPSPLYQPVSTYEGSTTYRVDNSIDHLLSSSRIVGNGSVPPSRCSNASFKPVISKNGFLIVYGYSPAEGESKVPISATVELRYPSDATSWEGQIKLRLVLGRTALTTSVRPLEVATDSRNGNAMVSRWQVSAIAPPFEKARYPRHVSVPLTLQALVGQQEVLDSITFGGFTYWEAAPEKEYLEPQLNSLKRSREEDYDGSMRNAPARRSPQQQQGRSNPSRSNTNSSSASQKSLFLPVSNGSQEGAQIPLASPGTTLVAAHGARDSSEGKSQRAVLEWVVTQMTPHPDTFDKNWSQEERDLGRRLVRFHRAHESTRLLVACEAVSQESYNERDIVISCICRPEAETYWFTSVDIIYLLERLVGASFTVEEKNRIRRNLEGFKPTTVSKSRPGFEVFFQRIMDFPVPKPRNIEKDVKVFPWSVLSPALHKILSKYSLFVGSTNAQTSPWLHSETPSGSPEGARSSLPPNQNSQSISIHKEERPFSSHSTRATFTQVPSQSILDVQHEVEQQVPRLTFSDVTSDVSGPWKSKLAHSMDQTSDKMIADDGLPASGHVTHEVFTSAYMHSSSSPFITLGEASRNIPDGSGPSTETSFTPQSSNAVSWTRSATWDSGNTPNQSFISDNGHRDGVMEERRKEVNLDGLNSQHGNSLLLELEPGSTDEIYPQYSLGTQTPIDDIIDHS